jgi:PAS domain S-box-containing protein
MTDGAGSCGVDDVIITGELDRRPSRDPDHESECDALRELADTMAGAPDRVLDRLAELAMALTRSDSAGISLLEPGGDRGIFRRVATAGAFAPFLDRTVDRQSSPCGEAIARDTLLLMKEPGRVFPSPSGEVPEACEALLAPFHVDGPPVGTVWAVKHGADGRFEREDGRILKSLARFAAAAHQMVRTLGNARRAGRESEERFRLIVESARDYAIFMIDPEDRITDWLPGAEAVFGWTRDEAIGRPAGITFTPEDRAEGVPGREIGTAAREGSAPDVRWHQRKDGGQVFIEGSVTPLRDEAGNIRGFVKIGQDVTERRHAQELLEASERRMRSLATGIPQLVFRSMGDGCRIWGSPQWIEYTNLSFEESIGFGWLERVHPEDREGTLAAWDGVEERGEYYCEHRIWHAASSEHRWHQTRATPSRDEKGRILEWLGTSSDVEELRRLQRHTQTLLAELQHRVRNTLGVIRSIARRTAASSGSVEEMATHLEGRIGAFSRVQAMVTRNPQGGVDLLSMVTEELLAHAARDGESLRIKGPDISFQPRAAESVSLAIHELATNSVKYGALSAGHGLLDVRWERNRSDDGEILRFVWEENGVELEPGEPQRKGFGFELLERTLPYDLEADTRVEFRREGLRFRMSVPLTEAVLAD